MMARLRKRWIHLQESLWFIPAVMTVVAIGLALATVELDRRLIASGHAGEMWFVFGVGAEGVRGVLSAIAGSIITVTGVVFSINIVALQLASTQFTPRVLLTFLEDRANHVVLGIFIATFTYALVILRFVRADSERLTAFVPSISVTVAMVLALLSIGCLIWFIHHSAHSMRASTIIARLVNHAVASACRMFPREIGRPAEPASPQDAPPGTGHLVRTNEWGYLQLVDEDGLLALSEYEGLTVRMEGRVGDFFRTGDVIASILGGRADDEALDDRVRDLFMLGEEPSAPQDVTVGIGRLVEIGVKALSPGINDPGTAIMCIDGLSEVLVVLGRRDAPLPIRAAEGGHVRLIARRPTFDELVDLAFDQIRYYGAGAPEVVERLLESAAAIAVHVPPERREPLRRAATHVAEAADRAIADSRERERVRAAADRALARIGSPEGDGDAASVTPSA